MHEVFDIPEDNYCLTLISGNHIDSPRLTIHLSGDIYIVTITFKVCEFYRLQHRSIATGEIGFLKPCFEITSTAISEYVVKMTGGMLLRDELDEYILTTSTETVTVVSDNRIVPEVNILKKMEVVNGNLESDKRF